MALPTASSIHSALTLLSWGGPCKRQQDVNEEWDPGTPVAGQGGAPLWVTTCRCGSWPPCGGCDRGGGQAGGRGPRTWWLCAAPAGACRRWACWAAAPPRRRWGHQEGQGCPSPRPPRHPPTATPTSAAGRRAAPAAAAPGGGSLPSAGLSHRSPSAAGPPVPAGAAAAGRAPGPAL